MTVAIPFLMLSSRLVIDPTTTAFLSCLVKIYVNNSTTSLSMKYKINCVVVI